MSYIPAVNYPKWPAELVNINSIPAAFRNGSKVPIKVTVPFAKANFYDFIKQIYIKYVSIYNN